jgi:hypothetical protein
MKTIIRTFPTLARAERYQQRLYGIYNRVVLIQFPRFGESGEYTWEVG